jgi:hypothetical protein
MKQEDVAGKILAELLELKIANTENDWILYHFLMQTYAAGYDSARFERTNQRAVVQYSLDGEFIDVFDSASQAQRKTGIDHSDIIKCAKGKRQTAGKIFQWKYVNERDPTSSEPQEETIEAYLKQLTREARRTRSSKKD